MFRELCSLTSKWPPLQSYDSKPACQCVVCADVYKPVTTAVVSVFESLSPCPVYEFWILNSCICMCGYIQACPWIRMSLCLYLNLYFRYDDTLTNLYHDMTIWPSKCHQVSFHHRCLWTLWQGLSINGRCRHLITRAALITHCTGDHLNIFANWPLFDTKTGKVIHIKAF